jgi:hypothetical protein
VSRLVLVEWIDSGMALSNEWKKQTAFAEELHGNNVLLVSSVGFLIHEDDEHLILGQSRDEHNDQYLNAQVIYRPCVRSVNDLTTVITADAEEAA